VCFPYWADDFPREAARVQKPLQINYRGIESSPALDALIRQRVNALGRMHPRITGCRVVVEVPYRSTESGKVPVAVTVEVEIPNRRAVIGKDVQERREAKSDQTAALNNAFEAVERQLNKVANLQIQEGKRRGADASQTGMIVRLFPEQGYGFVEVDNSSELYFTRNAVSGGEFDELQVGTIVHVTIATTDGPMGPQASSIRLLDKPKTG
jgi:cold shock CspA family protein/ribosome-associated translation inhibitor RaiA